MSSPSRGRGRGSSFVRSMPVATLAVATILAALTVTGCRNPLLERVEETIQAVVTAPRVDTIYPSENATNVPADTQVISVTFTKNIDPSTVGASTFYVAPIASGGGLGSAIPGTRSVQSETVSFEPSANLDYNTGYRVIVTTGLLDQDGNPLTSTFEWSFTTALAPDHDATPPAVTVFGVDGGRNATNQLVVTLGISGTDPDPNPSGPASYQTRLQGDEWSEWKALGESGSALEPDVALPDGTTAGSEVTFEGRVRDTAGNVSQVSETTVTYDITGPTLNLDLVSPRPDETGVPYDTSAITLVFGERMNPTTFTPESFSVVDTGSYDSADAADTDFTFASYGETPVSQVSLTGLSLEPNTDYFVTVAGTVEDVAGNAMGGEQSWFFRTGTATDTTAPTGYVYIESLDGGGNLYPDPSDPDIDLSDPNIVFATNNPVLNLGISATDDYNEVYGMNFWGEVDMPSLFEDPVGGWVPFSPSLTWTLDGTERTHSLWYRLQDNRGNKTPDPPGYFSVVLDVSAPTITSVQIVNSSPDSLATPHVNDPNGTIDLLLAGNDIGGAGEPGSGLYRMRLSNDGAFDPTGDDWVPWSPLVNDWQIDDAAEGAKTLYLQVQDYLTNTTQVELDYSYDTTPPAISFDPAGGLNVNAESTQTALVTDNVVLPADIDTDVTYAWEQVVDPDATDPGTVDFTDADARVTDVSADEDGVYLLRLTATDPAGNGASATVGFTWDTTPPDAMGTIAAADGYYTTTGRPELSWDPVAGADGYRVDLLAGATRTEIGSTDQTSFTPATGNELGEGESTIEVTPYDDAGNTSAAGTFTVFTDSIPPAIAKQEEEPRTDAFELDYSSWVDEDETDPTVSGIASVLWQQTEGPSTLTFTPPDALATTVSGGVHGVYRFSLTVTDNAGNASTANFTINWDDVAPNPPVVVGIDRTPNLRPTWSWSSGGNGGSGEYEYVLRGPDGLQVGSYTATGSATSFTPDAVLPTYEDPTTAGVYPQADNTYTLEVAEYDAVGNLSTVSARSIWIDPSFTAPPEVTLDGPTVRNTTLATWNWSSGGGNSTFRYRVGGGSWQPSDAGGPATSLVDYDTLVPVGNDVWVTIEVQEQDSVGSWPDPNAADPEDRKIGSSSVRIDRLGPAAPVLSPVVDTSATILTDASPPRTNDATPTWIWESNPASDGVGQYRYRLDDSDMSGATATGLTSFTPSSQLDGAHVVYVQEQDSLGNWGATGSYTIEVDTTPPAAPAVTLTSLAGVEFSTNSTTIRVTVSFVEEADGVDRWSYLDYGANPTWTDWTLLAPGNPKVFDTQVPAGEGNKGVYVRVADALGNIRYAYDSIYLDTTPPASASVVLNSGDAYTPSLDVYLDLGAADNYSAQGNLEVRYRPYTYSGTSWVLGDWSEWLPFASRLAANTNFSPIPGTKYVYVQYRDQAGNATPEYGIVDGITLQAPQPSHALKGYYTNGATTVYYSGVTEPTGSATTTYHVYYGTNPGFNPNADPDGDGVLAGETALTLAGGTGTTSTSADYVTIPTGSLYYFWVRARNPDSGGWGPFSTTSVLGFSSDVTVVYDDDDPADVDRAELIAAILTNKRLALDRDYVIGTMPDFTVTLLPEDLVPNTYTEGNRIFGLPVVLTPGVYSTTSSSYDGRVRNVAGSMRPVVAMGGAGGAWLYRVQENFTAWGLSGQAPSDIDSMHHMGIAAQTTTATRPYNTSNSIWYQPLRHANLDDSQGSIFTTPIFSADVATRGVYRAAGDAPVNGMIYAGDPSWTSHFPVVRQGRYLFFGFEGVPDTLSEYIARSFPRSYDRMGVLFFVNLISEMSGY